MMCWTVAGNVHVAIRENDEMRGGVRVVDLTTGDLNPNVYTDMDELIEGEGLDPELFMELPLNPKEVT